MLVTLHYADKSKTINPKDIVELREQIILNFYMNFLKQGYKKTEAYEMTGKEVGLGAERVKQIILLYSKN